MAEPVMQTYDVKKDFDGKKVRIAIIGTGGIAGAHIKAYENVAEAEIVAACDINETKLNLFCDRHGIPKENRYTSVDALLADNDRLALDAADVCVWNCNHASCSIAALNAGLHVFCEKPMAYNTEQAIAMKEAADRNGKLLMVGFVMRFSDETNVAMDFIREGALGDIYYTKATYLRRHGNPGGWFGDKSRSGGGPVIDLGVHVIDYNRYMMGLPKPVSVYAATGDKLGHRKDLKTTVAWRPIDAKEDDICDVEDFGTALIRFDNGSVMLLETSYSLNIGAGTTKRELFGTKGGMVFEKDLKIYTEMSGYMVDITPSISYLKDSKPDFVREMQHFVDCVRTGCECRAKAEDGIWVMKILDAIYESAKTGHEVTIK